MNDNFKPWKIEWTPEYIQRFWNWISSNPAYENQYYSKWAGDSIIEEAKKYIVVNGIVVDVGAGPGYLTEKLVNLGHDVLAVDYSNESMKILSQKMEGKAHFLGARYSPIDNLLIPDGQSSVCFLVEVIEHMDDIVLLKIINELYRILKPGGYLVITTPNEERLAERETICPNCGCVFHTVQHMRSWSAKSLSEYMLKAGFETIVCKPTLFIPQAGLRRQYSIKKIQLLKYPFPHLIYIGKKR